MESESRLHPEQRARLRIDRMLQAAGWEIQDYAGQPDFLSSPGVAIREVQTPTGPVDYLLVADGKVVGSIEAKAEGYTLRSVENQTDRYNDGFKALIERRDLPRYADELSFQYVSTGTETLFQSRRDPIVRGREVFQFHRPETLAAWAQESESLRASFQQLPPLNSGDLRDIQAEAIEQLEESLAADKPKALAAITMGGGKTRFAVAEAYRLLRYAGAQRILFLVDRVSLGAQAETEFLSYVSPDDGRRFGDDFVVQVMRSNRIETSTNVVICTIQRLYSMLRGEEREYDPEFDDVSSFMLDDGTPVEVEYNPSLPIEFFDLIYIDECHRSIYGRWGQVLDYFDAFQVGLTATPTPTTTAYFDENVIAEYSQEQSVFDGVNVDQQLYRIRSEVGEHGATIEAGEWIKVRDKITRHIERRQLEDEFIYEKEKLDRAVVNPSQIRAVVRTFKDRITSEIFPGRDEVPKTIFFAKHDQHAEDVLKIIREEFGRGSEFAKKITYKAEGTVEENINQFRNDPQMRIAVTVEQIGTGTDIKPVECLVFMRMVGSRVLFNQMRGRAVRTMSEDDFWQVTPGAQEKGQTKDYSVLIDAVGITDEETALIDAQPVTETRPSVPLSNLLRDVGMGLTDDDTLKAISLRLKRLNGKLEPAEREEFEHSAGATLSDIADALRQATDPTVQSETAIAAAAEQLIAVDAVATEPGSATEEAQGQLEALVIAEPGEEELAAARQRLVETAIEPIRRSEIRQKIESLQRAMTEQFIHIGGHDQLVSAAFVENPDVARDLIQTWREFITERKDEYLALKVYFGQPYHRRPSLRDIKELAQAIRRPPLNLTPERLWSAYEQLDADHVRGHGGKLATDLVRLIRYTLEQDDELVPYEEIVRLRFDIWLTEQQAQGREFTPEQLRWLELVRDHIARSMDFDPTQDYDFPPFSEEGGATAAYRLFGKGLNGVVQELNEALVAA